MGKFLKILLLTILLITLTGLIAFLVLFGSCAVLIGEIPKTAVGLLVQIIVFILLIVFAVIKLIKSFR